MQVDAAEVDRPYARKARFVTAKHLDRRTVAARKSAALIKQFTAALGGNPSAEQSMAIERAAMLAACAEDARVRRLAGDPSVSLNDLVRLDRLAAQTVRNLGLDRQREPERGPTFGERLMREAKR